MALDERGRPILDFGAYPGEWIVQEGDKDSPAYGEILGHAAGIRDAIDMATAAGISRPAGLYHCPRVFDCDTYNATAPVAEYMLRVSPAQDTYGFTCYSVTLLRSGEPWLTVSKPGGDIEESVAEAEALVATLNSLPAR